MNNKTIELKRKSDVTANQFRELAWNHLDVSKTLLLESKQLLLVEKEDPHCTGPWIVWVGANPDDDLDNKRQVESVDINLLNESCLQLTIDGTPCYYGTGLPVIVDENLKPLLYNKELLAALGIVTDKVEGHDEFNELIDHYRNNTTISFDALIAGLYKDRDSLIVTNRDFSKAVPQAKPEVVKEVNLDTEHVTVKQTPVLVVDYKGKTLRCYATNECLQAPPSKRFKHNLSLPESEGTVYIADTEDGLEEIFILEVTKLNYEHHKPLSFKPVKVYNENEGLVTDLVQELETFEMDPIGHAKHTMSSSGNLPAAVANVQALSSKTNSAALVETELYTPLFVLDDSDEGAISVIEEYTREKEAQVHATPGKRISTLVSFVNQLLEVNPLIGKRVAGIFESTVQHCLKDCGIHGHPPSLFGDLEVLKETVSKSGKAKMFFKFLVNMVDAVNLSIDLDEKEQTVLWLDERVHLIDGEVDSNVSLGRVNAKLSPDLYTMLSKAFITMGGTEKLLLSTTTVAGQVIEAYRLNVETGKGDSGIIISNIINI